MTITLTLSFKGGPGSGHRGHAGRPGSVGGSVSGVGGVAGDWRAYGDAPVPRPSRQDVKKFLREEGDVELYHVTFADHVDSIRDAGLVPAREVAMAQSWKAPHSKYATYCFADRNAAMRSYRDMEEHGKGIAAVIKVTLPRTMETASRILPDEDVSTNPNHGLRTLLRGESVAVIGGIRPDRISVE